MKTIWKFQVPIKDGIIKILMPKNAEIVHVESQDNQPCLWVLVDSENLQEIRQFRVYGTGHALIFGDTYVGTVAIQTCFRLVWHIFEIK